MLKLEPSPLRLPMQQSGSSPGLCTRTFNFQEIFKRTFKIYGIWPQARSVVYIHTHLRNAVPLVWGSLRLAPISFRLPFLSFSSFFLQSHQVWSLGESKESSTTSLHASSLIALHTPAYGFVCFCHPEVNDVIKNGPTDKVYS